MITPTAQTLLHLSLIPQVGPSTVLNIIQVLHKEFSAQHLPKELSISQIDLNCLHEYRAHNFVTRFGIQETQAQRIELGLADKKLLNEELALIKKYDIGVHSFLDQEYPADLKQIYYPPLILYTKGAPLNTHQKCLGVVGARKADDYAHRIICSLIPSLIQRGWSIISGGATGVDTMAHQATLDSGGKTVVVFGSGLMHAYPEHNKELFRAITRDGGTLVSPFALRMPPSKGHFPARNRIIAGLSKGCVVIQASQKSGALITAQFALEQGKQVFAVPGNIDNELSLGCHKLIQDGAKLVTQVNDILEEFGEIQEQIIPLMPNKKNDAAINKKQKKIISEELSHPLLKHFDAAYSLDELSNKTEISLSELTNTLFMLQLEGLVKQNFAGLWEKI